LIPSNGRVMAYPPSLSAPAGKECIMVIRLYENFRALLYVPFFAAHALDAYATEGVAVELMESPEPGLGARQVLAGEGELTWGGPMRILEIHERVPDCGLLGFCEVVGRDPFSLVGSKKAPNFQLTDLAKLKLASVSEVPTPWLCLQDDIRRAGLDPTRLDRVTDRSMADNVAALAAGTVDVVQLFEPYVTQAVAAGGHVWLPGAARGLTAYTTFYTTRTLFERHTDEFRRMTRAMYRTQKWLHAQTADTIAATVKSFFPMIALDAFTQAIAHYQALGIWNRDPVLQREGFERLKGALLSGGLIHRGTDYEVCVDTRLAEQAIADNPPAF
jgi:NitT/TauT family transport system substrate-binding protein